MGAKNVAVGAINCLSRSRLAAEVLRLNHVVEDTLMVVLSERGIGEKHEARIARATMAVANLNGEFFLMYFFSLEASNEMRAHVYKRTVAVMRRP